MRSLIPVVRDVTVIAFAVFALLSFRQWRRTHENPAWWAAMTFMVLAGATAALTALPDEAHAEPLQWVRKVVVGSLGLVPYCLYRFTASFRPSPRMAKLAGFLTAVVLVAPFLLPAEDFVEEHRPPSVLAYLVALMVQWTVLSVIASVTLWRAGRGQPTVARRRMRVLSLGAIGLSLALLLAGAAPDDRLAGIDLTVRLLALASGGLLFVGLTPPALLRAAWRRPEQAELREAVSALMVVSRPEEVADVLLPHAARVVGGRAAALVDEEGAVVGSHGIDADTVQDLLAVDDDCRSAQAGNVGGRIVLSLPSGWLLVWASPFTPFFGREELELLRSLGSLAQLAIERSELFERERAARSSLQQEKEFSESLIASSVDGILAFDREFRYTVWNPAMERITGMSKDEVLGRRAFDLFPFLNVIGEDRFFAAALAGRSVASAERPYMIGQTGRQGFFEAHYSPQYGEGGEIIGGLAVVRDTTERQREHRVVEALQRALLPQQLPEIPGLGLAARYVAGGAGVEVGGDWYDVIPLADGRVGLVIGDVVGRGLQAAAGMGQLRMAVRAYALEGHAPGAVVERVNRLMERLGQPQMASMVYLVADPGSGEIHFVNAGHPPPVLIGPNGSVAYLEDVPGLLLGVSTHAEYHESVVKLEPGQTLLLYTDGLVEKRALSLDEGMARLKRAAVNGPGELGALCDHLLGALVADQVTDDVALLAMRQLPVASERLDLRVPATPAVLSSLRRTLARWLEEAHANEEEAYDILVACGEACANVIEHAYGPSDGAVEVEAALVEDEVEVKVRDFGHWQASRSAGRGRGMQLMQGLMDTVAVRKGDAGTEVCMRRRLHRECEHG